MLLANRYQIVRMLGEGGFGQTFLAEDTQMPSRRMCVIKQLKPMTSELSVHQVIQERFQREAAILEKLGENHPQIPRLYAYFSDAGQFYLVQEWIEGKTLEQLATDSAHFNESSVRKVLLDLLPVLEFVHEQGMIHRDIKPENIILRNSNQESVLIDYGAVRETMGTVFNSRGNPTSSIVIGTPGYMPSEQAAGRPIPSSDLYSLGLTAIYLLTGKPPQMLETDPQTGEILWQQDAPQLSAEFSTILTQMVRSHPRDRYASATQLRSVLASPSATIPPAQTHQTRSAIATAMLASNPSSVVAPASPDRSKLITMGLIGSGFLIAALGISFFLNRDNAPTPVVQSPTASPTRSPSPSVQASPLTPPPDQPIPTRSPDMTPPPVQTPPAAAPAPSPKGQPLTGQAILAGIAGGQVRVYAEPSTRSTSPHYGLTGDEVTLLQEIKGDDRETWYYVKFPSGATGWIPEAQTRLDNDNPDLVDEFPRSAQLIGQTPGSRVNIRSAPSMSASSPNYGLVGDTVIALKQAQGDDGRFWYFVQFPSNATGWVRAEVIELTAP
ncbi:MAG: protein kinase [Leptolyngbya sp. Prado105]|jgi:serine/threonine-protein kinase|nr:protein kinase [Leptolyngbya sp. Prado105]